MNKKGLLAFLVIALVLLGGIFTVFSPNFKKVEAQTPVHELRGFAWSSNIGWVSFNSKDIPGSPDYSVTVNEGNALEGYAWSSNLGWIRFNPAYGDATNPTPAGMGDSFGAKIVGNELKGWARVCSVFVNNCSGALRPNTERGGWDGWIKMINVQYDSTLNGGNGGFTGFAWGDLNLGWMDFLHHTSPPPGCNLPKIDTDCDGDLDCDPCVQTCVVDCGHGGPELNCEVSPESGKIGDNFTWTANLFNVSGTPTYTWSGDDPLNGKTGESVTVQYNIAGEKRGSVTAVVNGNTYGPEDCENYITDVIYQCTNDGLTPPPGVSCCNILCPNNVCAATLADCPPTTCTANVSYSDGYSVIDINGEGASDDPTTSSNFAIFTLEASCTAGKSVKFVSGLPSDKLFITCDGSGEISNGESCAISSSIEIGAKATGRPNGLPPTQHSKSYTVTTEIINTSDGSTVGPGPNIIIYYHEPSHG